MNIVFAAIGVHFRRIGMFYRFVDKGLQHHSRKPVEKSKIIWPFAKNAVPLRRIFGSAPALDVRAYTYSNTGRHHYFSDSAPFVPERPTHTTTIVYQFNLIINLLNKS